MIYLGLRTDSPVAEYYLYDESGMMLANDTWHADRRLARDLLGCLEHFLSEQNHTLAEVNGLFIYRGPGSFTGLRIGITVMNTIAYSQSIPIIGGEGEGWRESAVSRLMAGANEKSVLPLYSSEARITKPKK